MKKKLSKAAFIRKYPNVSPKDLVQIAKSKGIVFSAMYVYNVRNSDKPGREKKIKAEKKPESHGALEGKQKSGHYGGLASAKTKRSRKVFASSFANDTAMLVRESVIAFLDEKVKATEDLISQLRKVREMFDDVDRRHNKE